MTKIRDIRAYVRAGTEGARQQPGGRPTGFAADVPWVERPIASPLSVYPGHDLRTVSGPAWVGDVVVEVESDDGATGVAVSVGGRAASWVVEDHLAHVLLGEPLDTPWDIERAWDRMWRCSQFYGRRGVVLHALSAVDLALWDLLGIQRDQPVIALLGGPCRDTVEYYATSPDAAGAQRAGFLGGKLPLPYGAGAGSSGLEADIEYFAAARDAVGDDFFLAYDCWMALDEDSAGRLAVGLLPYRPRWLEECLMPDDYEGYSRLRSVVPSGIALASGEHEGTRWGFRVLAGTGALQLAQPDPTWCGGLTELKRIVSDCEARGIPVVCHGSSAYALHPSAAWTGIPMAECIMGGGAGDVATPFFGDLFETEPIPRAGSIDVSSLTAPGFGLRLSSDALLVRPTRHDEPRTSR